MCDFCPRAAKLIRALRSGNKKDENAVSCAHNLRLVTTKPCTSPATNIPTCKRLQLWLAYCKRIMVQPLVARQTRTTTTLRCTTRRTSVQRDRLQRADRFSVSRTIGKLRIQTAVPKRTQSCSQKRSCRSTLLAYKLNSVGLHCIMVHSSSSYLSSCYSSSSYLPPKVSRC